LPNTLPCSPSRDAAERVTTSTQAVFLSYASQDAEAARRICDALQVLGLEVWFDQSALRGGDAWDASIRRQIKECALFEVTAQVAAAVKGRSTDPEAYRLFLQARYIVERNTREDTATGIGYLKQALALEPEFALAWAGAGPGLRERSELGLGTGERGI
jgi:hypothetical protein